MTPEKYNAKADELGVSRGQLDEGFKQEPSTISDTPKAVEQMAPEPTPVLTVASAPKTPPADIEVMAEQPQEMEECQHSLIEWAKRKIETVKADFTELNEAYLLAVKNKWKSTTLKRHALKAESLVNYYTKMLGAFEAGYVLVPNMPGALFAVRTEKVCPSKTWKYSYMEALKQPADTSLTPGAGKYVAGDNETNTLHLGHGDQQYKKYQATGFGTVEFPFALSKPRLMEATSRAMALRLFDEFMILPAEAAPAPGRQTVTRQDPIILGIISNRSPYWNGKSVSFMIAWHIDTRAL